MRQARSPFLRQPSLPGVEPPRPIIRPPVTRKVAMIAKAEHVLAHIPGPGESLHAVVSGRDVDASKIISALVARFGAAGAVIHLASLSMSRRNFFKELVPWADGGAFITLLVSSFFFAHNRAFWRDEVAPGVAERPSMRVAHALNHCKVAALSFADGAKWAMEGSANLKGSGGGNWEQFSLVRDDALHDFHAGWIAERVEARHGEAKAETE